MDEALTLFSVNGYKGTSVKCIADAVGIKDSSLYKHYRNKQAIFEAIVAEMRNRMGQIAEQLELPMDDNIKEAADVYKNITTEKLLSLSKAVFLFYLKDPFVSRFRRMAIIEQYANKEIYAVYHTIFMEDSIAYQRELFEEMIQRGQFIQTDPEVMAMNFYTPIFFLINKYDQRENEIDEALDLLEKMIREFVRIYAVK